MSGQDDDEHGPRGGLPLPREVQEHLGRKLRTELRVDEGQPQFLGDTALPPKFDNLIRQIEAGEQGQRQGFDAVRNALVAGMKRGRGGRDGKGG